MSDLHFASHALLPTGWARDVRIRVENGRIAELREDASPEGAQAMTGFAIPAMPNLHSHAFQRAIAGRTGTTSPSGDDTFWTWRQAMYAFVDRVDPEAFEAIAAQAYVEMAKAGYCTVAEFHYVHHDPAGKPYSDPAELSNRVVAAAEAAGLALTLLPVFYAHSGFGGAPPKPDQRRFMHTPASYARLLEILAARREGRYTLGVAPHSLRAVAANELHDILSLALPGAPIHIHAAEQTREVEECVAWSGLRPVEWLLAHAPVDARWCLVHATHMTEREVLGLAASEAIAGLAPTTEADLGDGTFPGGAFVAAHGRYGVGSDSNTVIDPFAELRQLEYSQRLIRRRRNVMNGAGRTVGESLWLNAAKGGAQACAHDGGELAVGRSADWVVLDADDAALLGHGTDTVLDAAVFGPARRPVRDVMASGRWIVRDGVHVNEDAVLERFRSTIQRLFAATP